MTLPQVTAHLKEQIHRAVERQPLPCRCIRCHGTRLGWKDRRPRGASVLHDGRAVHLDEIPVRRVKCLDCGKSWTLQPPGILPRKHYQPCVAAQAVSRVVYEPGASQRQVAEEVGCSRRQVGRWLGWVGSLASPDDLQARVVEEADAPVVVDSPPLARRCRQAYTAARQVALLHAARVLVLLEVLASVWGLEPPGLRGVLVHLSEGWQALSSYTAPAIPVLAPRPRGEAWGSIVM